MPCRSLHNTLLIALLLPFVLASNTHVSFADSPSEKQWPARQWIEGEPADVDMDRRSLEMAREYALTGDGSGYITRHGRLVMSWGDPNAKYDLKSTTKSIGVTALGLAIADGKIQLSDLATDHHPSLAVPPESNQDTGWIDEITIEHLATQTAGFEKPGGYTKLIYRPGTKWAYSDGGPNWLAECVTLVYQQDVEDLMFQRVFQPLGITTEDLSWRRNSYRKHTIDDVMRREFGSGISANVDAMARIGYLYLCDGQWKGQQIIPQSFVDMARQPRAGVVGLPEVDPAAHGNASDHYGLLWWNNADGTLEHVPRDAYWSWGLYDSLILVIPSLDIVASRAGKSWQRESTEHYDVLKPFFEPIVRSAQNENSDANSADGPATPDASRSYKPTLGRRARQTAAIDVDQPRNDLPYPPSSVIKTIDWAPKSMIKRGAHGSDNWPITWADDNLLYTAYGDGRGFKPYVERKLSMGLCTVAGPAHDFQGVNLRSPTAERLGDGRSGPKASGMLMVDGVLYMLVRNVDNAQLAWSTDHGKSWNWSQWKFDHSFGYPSFLNFGQNYDGARDQFVYVYSHDADSAYERADQMVLARVPQDQVTDRQAYEFFRGLHDTTPMWTPDVHQRAAVFHHVGNCYRSAVSYNAGLRRYLWCQTGAGDDTRFSGGLAIYDAPRPWGPWTTAYYAKRWDVGPGETSSLPTKWMSRDGETIHLVFSGDDAFSVREGTVLLTK